MSEEQNLQPALTQEQIDLNRTAQRRARPEPKDHLLQQMRELGTDNYWEAVHLTAERERRLEQGQEQTLCRALFGFDLI